MQKQFEVFMLQSAREFVLALPDAAKRKVIINMGRAAERPNADLLKKLHADIWEFRTLYNGIQYRLLAFWDKSRSRLVIATHGFIKKTDKVPGREIQRAIVIRQLYMQGKTEQP